MIWVVIAQIVNVLTLTLVTMILSRYIGTDGVGITSIYLGLVLVMNQLFFNGLNASINRFFFTYKNLTDYQLILNVINACKNQILPATIIFILISYFAFRAYDINLIGIFSVYLYSFTQGIFAWINTIENARGKRKKYAINIFLESMLRLILILILFKYVSDKPELLIAALLISTSVIILIKYIKSNKNFCKIDNKELIKINKYSKPYFYFGVASWSSNSADKFIIGYFLTSILLGQHVYLYQFGYSSPIMIVSALMIYLTPKIYSKIIKDNERECYKSADKLIFIICNIILLSGILISVLIYIIQSELLTLIIGVKYESYKYLYLYFLSGTIYILNHPFSLLLNLRYKTNLLIIPKYIHSILFFSCLILGFYYESEIYIFILSALFSSVIYLVYIYVIFKKNV